MIKNCLFCSICLSQLAAFFSKINAGLLIFRQLLKIQKWRISSVLKCTINLITTFQVEGVGRRTAQNPYQDLRHIPISETLKCEKSISESRKTDPLFPLWYLCQALFPHFIPGSDAWFCSCFSRVFVKKLVRFHLMSELWEEIRDSF